MKKEHMIDILFPAALFLALAAFTLPITLLAADVYQKSVAAEEENYAVRTGLSYVTEKIRRSSEKDGVTLGYPDGVPCLMLRQRFGEQTYVTYLYHDGGILRELLLKEGVAANASDGQEILRVKDFRMTKRQDGILKIDCGGQNGWKLTAYAAADGWERR